MKVVSTCKHNLETQKYQFETFLKIDTKAMYVDTSVLQKDRKIARNRLEVTDDLIIISQRAKMSGGCFGENDSTL